MENCRSSNAENFTGSAFAYQFESLLLTRETDRMSGSTKLFPLVHLKKVVREKFPVDWVTTEFILELPDYVADDEFLFLAKTLEELIQIETRKKN